MVRENRARQAARGNNILEVRKSLGDEVYYSAVVGRKKYIEDSTSAS
jgi:hypothetical protein